MLHIKHAVSESRNGCPMKRIHRRLAFLLHLLSDTTFFFRFATKVFVNRTQIILKASSIFSTVNNNFILIL